ncbi:nitroreductase family deazaflavin-dependent oxidoreductase [Microbacterium marinilacus]|uniref:Nitroreductase family deazaflavin-dependent oxidoreductase n=1 Tax=Microbacterium marinilacus TaxID=415209 RepID=A0ABP7BEV4_9MICO|nr:nitroreductase family deazaflavin-dependent oxidoreductase [Microbacterium marinilacus]MBY0689341.1 nitroreductase family deazaflavin-dependent oxidoreductase [Microbacterium marinilacus]
MSSYRITPFRRWVDRIMAALGRRGVAPGGVSALTVAGRRSGEPRTVPVTPVEVGGRRYLVAPYGPVEWVRNLRAAGEATLQRGAQAERIRVTELDADAAAPVLKHYVQRIAIVRPHVAAAPDADVSEFAAIASHHPVFLVAAAR